MTKDKKTIHELYSKHFGENKHLPKKRGVKEGTVRGKYNIKKKAIKNPNKVTFTCKQCGREDTYIRKGKRRKEFCSNKCRQKAYRQRKELKEIELRKDF